MAIIQCSSALSSIGIGACPCGTQGYQVAPSGSMQVDFNASPTSWTNSQRNFVRNACCNATCEVFCSAQPAACSEGGSMITSDATLTSGIKNPPRPPKDVSRRRNASGMRSAIGGGRWCNCDITIPLADGGTKRTQGTKVCRNNPNECCGSCRPAVPSQKSQTSQSTQMKKATGSRVSTYWGGLKIK